MKKTFKILAILLALTLVLTLFVGCGGDSDDNDGSGDGITKVCLLINGNLGDKSFFDSAKNGIDMINESNPEIITTVKELGNDASNWESALREACLSTEKYDLIIVGTDQMREKLQRIAPQFPTKSFIIFDSDINKEASRSYSNVYSIMYKQNEGSFLAGVLAASWLNALQNGQAVQKAGFVGGMNTDIIKDFAIGYYKGIEYVNNLNSYGTTKTFVSYVGGFSDSVTGKSQALSQYNAGASIIFQAASQSGLGCIDAAKQLNANGLTKYIIGVDSDQNEYYSNGDTKDPDKAACIVTSVLKRVDLSLKQAVLAYHNGNLALGTVNSLGVAAYIDGEQVIGLAKNDYYNQIIPQSVRDLVDEAEEKIVGGEITVPSSYTTSRSDFNDIEDAIKVNG
mgnify:CR=1 FL=1